ncbi:hypothetical protein BDY24DRAFT_440531 [Mrakia frigida]|uniref:uncharacterized protein n=1 Tax=Mrakia frigida TaxID=29902 RepID=UPI003FCBF7BE
MLPLQRLLLSNKVISRSSLNLLKANRSFSLGTPSLLGPKVYQSRPPDPRTYHPEDPDRFVQGPYDPLNPMGDWATRDPRQNRAGHPGKHEADPQLFGYPELPPDYAQFRDPTRGWWWKQERRNFGEFVPEGQDLAGIMSVEQKPHVNSRIGWYVIASFGGLFVLLYLWEDATYQYPVAVEREFPYDGLFLANGSDIRKRYQVFREYPDADKFEGSQREYYLGPGGADNEYMTEEEIKAKRRGGV